MGALSRLAGSSGGAGGRTDYGQFILPEGAERSQALREELGHHARLQRELAALRVQAVKEKQMGRRVELNLEIKQLESELALIMRGLGYKGS